MSNFWKTVPSILLGIAAIIALLVGISELIGFFQESIDGSRNSNSIINEDIGKYEIEKAIIKYLDKLEEAYSKKNTEILKEVLGKEALSKEIKTIDSIKWNNSYYEEDYKNLEIINYKLSSNKSKVFVNIKVDFESAEYLNNTCLNYIPNTKLFLNITLEKIDNIWKITEYERNIPLHNLVKRC